MSRLGLGRGLIVAVIVLGVAALAAGVWGWQTASSLHPRLDAGVGETVAVPGGELRLDSVEEEGAHDMGDMPAEMMPDAVGEGLRRVMVSFTLRATEADGLAYGPERFRVDSDASSPVEIARLQLAEGVMPQGSQLTGLAVLDVPESASMVRISFDGADEWAGAEFDEAAGGHGHDHDGPGDGDHDD